MNLIKIFLLIGATIFSVANTNENNQTNDLNQSKRVATPLRAIYAISMNPNVKNNEPINFNFTIGNPNYAEKKIKGTFKVVDMSGNILSRTSSNFTIPPRKARTYRSNSLKVANISMDTKAYIEVDMDGVISRSNYFVIHK